MQAIFDRLFSSRTDRRLAEAEVVLALRSHGENAAAYLQARLDDPNRRSNSKRVVRMALRHLSKIQAVKSSPKTA
jgi:hypothetical protein